MSSYMKISYITPMTNQALRKCIIYIGKYYGSNGETEDVFLKFGIKYLAKNCRTSRTAVKKMIYADRIPEHEAKQWSFKKRKYSRLYKYIVDRLLNKKRGNRKEAIELLHNLYVEEITAKVAGQKVISDILVLKQKEMISWAINKEIYEKYQDEIKDILKSFRECDKKYEEEI